MAARYRWTGGRGTVDSGAAPGENDRTGGAGREAVAMIPVEGETQRLRELHELYIWQVNAAVAEGRDDLVAELADEYLEAAVAELAGGRAAGGESPGVPDGAGVGPLEVVATDPPTGTAWDVVESRPRHGRWWRRRR
jgi:hypothetical protein